MKISLDIWKEIISTIRQNKLRTFLTGFSVAWGIFMLIILLGAGNGLINGFTENFKDRAINSMSVSTSRTSLPYQGFKERRRIRLDNTDLELTKTHFPKTVDKITGAIYPGNKTLTYKGEYVIARISGVHPEYLEIEPYDMSFANGRFINHLDVEEARKVIIIHPKTAKTLFKDDPAIGKFINVDKIAYKVVGVYTPDESNNTQHAFIPFSTAQLIYSRSKQLNQIYFTTKELDTKEKNEAFEKEYRQLIAAHHQFNPKDRRALWLWNRATQYLQTVEVNNILMIAVWVIGIFTLLSGIVGISNIMLITVKERTKEFGIRKALGATPASILWLIILESVLITTLFGYLGMVAGVGVTEWAAFYFDQPNPEQVVDELTFSIFKDPTVNLKIAIQATLVLIISGTLAGLFPARKAVKIKPIEALKAD